MSLAYDLARWEAGGEHIALLGHDIFVRREGAGPTLLTLHGFPSASWDWSPVWAGLTAHFDVIAFDLLGFGLSAKPKDHPLTIMSQAALALALLERLGVGRYHLLAHDYGDTVAQELLARDLEPGVPTIASTCLLNGGLFPETHRARPIQKLLLSPLGPLLARFTGKGALRKSFTRIFGPDTPPSDAELDVFWALLERNDGRSALPRLIRYMPQRRENRERWVRSLREHPSPIRLVNGSLDPVSGEHMVRRYEEVVGRGDVVRLPRIGHYPQVEAPEAVLAAFLDFHGIAPE